MLVENCNTGNAIINKPISISLRTLTLRKSEHEAAGILLQLAFL